MMPASAASSVARTFGADEEIARAEIDDAAEATDIVGALDGEPPEGEIREVGIERGLGVAGEEAPPDAFALGLLGPADQRHARPLQWIAGRARAVEQDRGAGVQAQDSWCAARARR